VRAAQFQKLADKAATLRQEIFGFDAKGRKQKARYDSGTTDFECYYTPVRTQEQLDDLSFKDVHDTIVRFSKSVAVTPAIGATLRLIDAKPTGDLVVRISEFGMSGANPEHVLGCKALF
jgi:hypothetical protein